MKNNTSRKILLTGLSNSGKTSINEVIKGHLSEIAIPKPTYLIDRSVFSHLDYEIMVHDLGGQKNYLISYLKEPQRFMGETDVAVLVIDIQDEARFPEALAYLGDMLDKNGNGELFPALFVCFHKAESYLTGKGKEETPPTDPLPRKEEKTRLEALEEMIQGMNPGGIELHFHVTSIYVPSTIVKMYSHLVNLLYPKPSMLRDILQRFAGDIKASIVSLVDENLLPIESYTGNIGDDIIVKLITPELFRMKKQMNKEGLFVVQEKNKGATRAKMEILHAYLTGEEHALQEGDLAGSSENQGGFLLLRLPCKSPEAYMMALGMRAKMTEKEIRGHLDRVCNEIIDVLGLGT